MRLTYAGCNMFGQVVSSSELSIDRFREYQIPDNLIDIALGHSIIIYLRPEGVFFHGHGLQPRETHQITRVEVPTCAKMVRTRNTSVYLLDYDGKVYILDFLAKNPQFVCKPLKTDSITSIQGVELRDKVIDFAPGETINVGVTESGMFYNFPNKLNFTLRDNASVKKICAGYEHCLILDTLGNVYSFGNGRRGQLGHDNLGIEETPRLIDVLAGIYIMDISSGGWHSMALSRDGDVYIWGWNSEGQLGLFDELRTDTLAVVPIPQYLPLPEKLNVAHISAGGRHSICITSDNKVYAFGCNKFNQLGITDFELVVNRPVKVHEMPVGARILRVEAGATSTAIISAD